ncbi:MAG: HAD family hydrolase [Candidatus Caldarchaeum sp.]|nr:HAD family hydrolase [Candidatus Caldarchaeum sp.]
MDGSTELGSVLKAVLFDFDNTLVDSARVLPLAQRRVAAEVAGFLGVDFDGALEAVRRVEAVLEKQGVYDRDRMWMHVLRELGFNGVVEERLLRSWTLAYWEEYAKGEVFPEAPQVLRALGNRYSLGLVTNTDGLDGMKRFRLERKGLKGFFKVVVVAGEDVPEVKPSPRPFLHAAELMGARPAECVMVGDDPVNDVSGAKAAGMRAVLLDRSGGKPVVLKPDHVVSTLSSLLTLFP